VLIVAGIGLLDVATLRRLRPITRFEYRLSIATTIGVLVAGVLPGILIAVALAIVKLVALAARPTDALLADVAGDGVFRDVADHPDATAEPGLIVYRFDAGPLFFNAGYLVERVRQVVAAAPSPPVWFVYSAEGAGLADFTGVEALERIRGELAAQGITLAIARPRGQFQALVVASGLVDRIGPTLVFPSVGSAVGAFRARNAGTRPRAGD
jgi:sulfate permease, SulP family